MITKKLFTAFTLAEILITLAIIGIVAAITIPSLMQKTQEQEFKTAWKKEYSTMTNAFMQVLNDNGGSVNGLCSSGTQTVDQECFFSMFTQKLKVQKYCKYGTAQGNCWHKNNVAKNLGGGEDHATHYNWAQTAAILNDGTFIASYWWDSGCDANLDNGSSRPFCTYFIIDVNGNKQPNTQGKDIFMIYFDKDNSFPSGVQGEYAFDNMALNGCSSAQNTIMSGFGCSAKYLKE